MIVTSPSKTTIPPFQTQIYSMHAFYMQNADIGALSPAGRWAHESGSDLISSQFGAELASKYVKYIWNKDHSYANEGK